MKNNTFSLLILGLLILTGNQLSAQESKKGNLPDPEKMTTYFMAFLKIGPDRSHDSVTAAKIQEGHMAHIMKMAGEKKLVLAGPFMDKGDIRGIFILNVATMEEAVELTSQDPAVKSGRLSMEIHPWYGPVKLKEISWD
jgi:uncharacterized protein YciI